MNLEGRGDAQSKEAFGKTKEAPHSGLEAAERLLSQRDAVATEQKDDLGQVLSEWRIVFAQMTTLSQWKSVILVSF